MADTVQAIVSFTTTSYRIQYIVPMIESILNGMVLPSRFVLNLCKASHSHMDQGLNEVPDGVMKFVNEGKMEIHWCEDNYGAFTKLRPTLERFWADKDQVIVTADDDTIYPKYWLKRLIEESLKSPDAVIAYRARPLSISNGVHTPYEQNPIYRHNHSFAIGEPCIVTGKDGAVYKPRFFTEQILDDETRDRLTKFNDDLWISPLLCRQKVPVRVIASNADHFGSIAIPEGKTLWNVNRVGNDQLIRNTLYLYGVG